jgi:hypothetical protein
MSPVKRKFESQPIVGKVMLTVFLDLQGSVLEHYQERGLTLKNSHYYDELKPAI